MRGRGGGRGSRAGSRGGRGGAGGSANGGVSSWRGRGRGRGGRGRGRGGFRGGRGRHFTNGRDSASRSSAGNRFTEELRRVTAQLPLVPGFVYVETNVNNPGDAAAGGGSSSDYSESDSENSNHTGRRRSRRNRAELRDADMHEMTATFEFVMNNSDMVSMTPLAGSDNEYEDIHDEHGFEDEYDEDDVGENCQCVECLLEQGMLPPALIAHLMHERLHMANGDDHGNVADTVQFGQGCNCESCRGIRDDESDLSDMPGLIEEPDSDSDSLHESERGSMPALESDDYSIPALQSDDDSIPALQSDEDSMPDLQSDDGSMPSLLSDDEFIINSNPVHTATFTADVIAARTVQSGADTSRTTPPSLYWTVAHEEVVSLLREMQALLIQIRTLSTRRARIGESFAFSPRTRVFSKVAQIVASGVSATAHVMDVNDDTDLKIAVIILTRTVTVERFERVLHSALGQVFPLPTLVQVPSEYQQRDGRGWKASGRSLLDIEFTGFPVD